MSLRKTLMMCCGDYGAKVGLLCLWIWGGVAAPQGQQH
jgi:hypothetical protein